MLAIGGPLIGRGIFIGTNVVRTQLPWSMETPSSFQFRLPPLFDTIETGTPSRMRIRETLFNDHRVALWDPYASGGTPLGSQPNTGIFAPINWPLLLLGVKLGTAWAGLLRLSVAAAATYFLLRRLGLSRFASACGGLIYCTSGFIVSWNNWPQADLAAMIPLLFFTADRLRERRRLLDLVVLAGVIGAMLLEGYPPLLIATFYALGGFLLVRWWESSNAGARGAPSIAERLRTAFRPLWLLVGAVALGFGLAAFQVVPFIVRLGVYNTSYRSSTVDGRFPASALLTSVFPWANGNPARAGTKLLVDHIDNHSMTEQFLFLGAAAMVFVLLALVLGPSMHVSVGIYRYCVAITVVLVLVLFGQQVGFVPNVGGWLRSVLYKLPAVGEVPLRRFVALLLFFATLLAAFGIEHVVGEERRALRFDRRTIRRAVVAFGFAAFMIALAIRDEIRLTEPLGRAVRSAGVSVQRKYILTSAIVPTLIVVATVVVIVVAGTRAGKARRIAIFAIPVLLAFEGLLVTATMFPRVADRDFYPQTGTIRYLSDHLAHERIAPANGMLTFATNSAYGLRSVGGHSFTPPTWRQLFLTLGAGTSFPTQLRLPDPLGNVAQSPILDRLAARYLVAPPFATFGAWKRYPTAPRTLVVGDGATVTAPVAPGPLRGVALVLSGLRHLQGNLVFLEVKVRGPSGRVVARGIRRLKTHTVPRVRYNVAIPGEHLATDVPWTVEVGIRSDGHDTVSVAATARGIVSLGVVRPRDDGLQLVYADPGAIVYRRLTALPRIRWADRTLTIPGARARRTKLESGVAADTVILSKQGPPASGKPARVTVDEDSGDRIRAAVDAKGAGYLVVADAIQDDWSATVDGHSVNLRDADHALVAVPIPGGRHRVEFSATPRGWRTGIAASLVSALLIAGLVGSGLLRRRGARRVVSASAPDVVGDRDHLVIAKVDSK